MQFLKLVLNFTAELALTKGSDIEVDLHLLVVRIVFLLDVLAEVFRHFQINLFL